MVGFFHNLFFGQEDVKFNKMNKQIIDNQDKTHILNHKLISKVRDLECTLNRHYGTRGTVRFLDLVSGKHRNVPKIHIEPYMYDWGKFGDQKRIDLNVIFHFDTLEHTEMIGANLLKDDIEFTLGKYHCLDIGEFCVIVEAVVDSKLGIK